MPWFLPKVLTPRLGKQAEEGKCGINAAAHGFISSVDSDSTKQGFCSRDRLTQQSLVQKEKGSFKKNWKLSICRGRSKVS